MSYLKMSPIYGQSEQNNKKPLSLFCVNLKEAKGVIDRQEEYIASLHKEINQLRKELKKYTNKYILTEAEEIKIGAKE